MILVVVLAVLVVQSAKSLDHGDIGTKTTQRSALHRSTVLRLSPQ
jgi:hypothetical protein